MMASNAQVVANERRIETFIHPISAISVICVRSMLKRVGARFICTLFVALVWLGASALAADKATEDSIRAFIERVNAASLDLFSTGSEAEARTRARTLLAWAFDVPAMGKEALGRAWDAATEEERSELLEAFEEDVIGAYLRRMRPEGTTLTFVGHRPPSDGNYVAASRRSVPGKKDQIWIWLMRPEGDSWRIIDLLLGGHSGVYTARHEYASVLESNNGDINALIAFMRKRAAQ
jgi:phospholipid transport system substrate-binding protein